MAKEKIVATYSLDIPTLTQFDESGPMVIYYDQNKYRGHIVNSLRNRQIRLVPISPTKGRYHSKFYIENDKVIIRSANLAICESQTCLNFQVGPFSVPAGFAPEKSNLIIFRDKVQTGLKNELPFESVLEWMQAALKNQASQNVFITIAAPNYISEEVLEKILKLTTTKKVIVSTFSNDEVCFKSKVEHHCFVPASKTQLHGKLLYIRLGNQSLLYVGSSNFTKKGFEEGNVETGVIYEETITKQNDGRVRELLSTSWQRVPTPISATKDDDVDPDDLVEEFTDFEEYALQKAAFSALDITYDDLDVKIKIQKAKRGFSFTVVGEDENKKLQEKTLKWHQKLRIKVFRDSNFIAELPIPAQNTEQIEAAVDVAELLKTTYAGSGYTKGKKGALLEKDDSFKYVRTKVAIPWQRMHKMVITETRLKSLYNMLEKETDIETRTQIINIIAIFTFRDNRVGK